MEYDKRPFIMCNCNRPSILVLAHTVCTDFSTVYMQTAQLWDGTQSKINNSEQTWASETNMQHTYMADIAEWVSRTSGCGLTCSSSNCKCVSRRREIRIRGCRSGDNTSLGLAASKCKSQILALKVLITRSLQTLGENHRKMYWTQDNF